jgi:hypothetical protein
VNLLGALSALAVQWASNQRLNSKTPRLAARGSEADFFERDLQMNRTTLLATDSTARNFLLDSDCSPLPHNDVRRMWDGGPLRQFSDKQAAAHYVTYSSPILKGYAGAYVCGQCRWPSAGVYFVRPVKNWFCGSCKRTIQALDKPVQQPEGGDPAQDGAR